MKEDRVDWIKIDVEGHELEVLERAMQTIRIHEPRIIIEIWQKNIEKIKDYGSQLWIFNAAYLFRILSSQAYARYKAE